MRKGTHEHLMRLIILLLLCCSVVSAWNKHHDNFANNCTYNPSSNDTKTTTRASEKGNWDDDPYGEDFSAHIGFLCVLMMLLGIYLMIASFRLFSITIGVIGFLLGSIVCWVLLTAAEPKGGYTHPALVYSLGSYGAGLVVGGACICFWRVAMYFIPVLGGYLFAVFIWSWRSDLIIHNVYARQFASVGFSVAAAVAMIIVEYVTVCLCTSFLGAYLFMLGLDMLVHAKIINGVRAQLDASHDISYHADKRVYAMLAGVLGLGLISVIFQLVFNRGRRFGLDLVKKNAD